MTDDIIIDWKKYVDHIYVVDFTKTTNNRVIMTKELKRLGMYDIDLLTIFSNISTPFYKELYKHFNTNDSLDKCYAYNFDCTMAHYFCIKQAYELGYDHIMVLENDMCFLKNKQYIKNILESCYESYDRFDTFVLDNNIPLTNIFSLNYSDYVEDLQNFNTVFLCNEGGLRSAGCNIYNRKAMTQIIQYYENFNFVIIDVYETNNNSNKVAYSFPTIGIQQKKILIYEDDIRNLYTNSNLDYIDIINIYHDIVKSPYNITGLPEYDDIHLKNGYEYIKKYCASYMDDEDFKVFEKIYNSRILKQNVSFDDIDKSKIKIFKELNDERHNA